MTMARGESNGDEEKKRYVFQCALNIGGFQLRKTKGLGRTDFLDRLTSSTVSKCK